MEFGPLPDKRQIPEFVKKQSPEAAALNALRRQKSAEAKHESELKAARKRADTMAEQLALQVYKKRMTEGDSFVLSMRQLLRTENITLITYEGEPLTSELEENADIVEWLPADEETEERVVEAIEPEIRWDGRLIHRAKLSCRMAKEIEDTGDTETEIPTPAAEAEVPEKPESEESVEAEQVPEAESEQTPNPEAEQADAAKPVQQTPGEPAEAPQEGAAGTAENEKAPDTVPFFEKLRTFFGKLFSSKAGEQKRDPAENTEDISTSKAEEAKSKEAPSETAVSESYEKEIMEEEKVRCQ